jgi:hypothetical protein
MEATVSHETHARVLFRMLAAAVILALPTAADAGVDSAGPLCAGLDCGSPTSRDYVSEAHGAAPAAAGIDQLKAERESGFYEIPAPIYQGDVQPQAVVYLSTAGQFGRMPASVRNLTVVRDFEMADGSEVKTATLVVIDGGILYVMSAEPVGAARGLAPTQRRSKAQAAHAEPWHACSDKYFCLYPYEDWGGGWWNLTGGSFNNWPDSMVNHRDNGDSLLADGSNGAGTRYCARQHSEDSTFSGNPLGNNQASSYALLGSNVDRC